MAVINGTSGDDNLNGNFGEDDVIHGLEGHDWIYGRSGNDILHGDEGDDRLEGEDGDDQLWGGDGDDVLRGGNENDFLDGGTGGGNLDGGDGDDIIHRRGSEFAQGGIGADHVFMYDTGGGSIDGGQGVDRLSLDFSNAAGGVNANIRLLWVVGSAQINTTSLSGFEQLAGDVLGSGFDDYIDIGFDYAPALVIRGGAGEDTLFGALAADVLWGGADDDELYGRDANDILHGEQGNDYLRGGEGLDQLFGGDGHDNLGGENGDDVITDLVGNNQFSGGNGADILTGGAGSDSLSGGDGADILTPGAGFNTIDGGNGDDIIRLVGGSGSLSGGGGTDQVTFDFSTATSGVIINLTSVWSGGFGGLGGYSSVNGIESLHNGTTNLGSGFNDLVIIGAGYTGTFWFDGGGGDDIVTGGSGSNVLMGGAGADQLTSGAVSNALLGGDGDDRLTDGIGANILGGGVGNDTYVVSNGTSLLTEHAGEGTDTVQATISWTLGANFENLTLTSGNLLTATGNELDNVITGSFGNNTLIGAGGNDTINGGGASDTIYSGDGNDVVNAGAGMDVVYDTAGNNTLNGGDGDDGLFGADGIYQLNGDAGADDLFGGGGNDRLDGGTGDDYASGGLGDDVYIVDATADEIFERADEGTDRVEVRAAVNYTLADHIENAAYTGTAYGTLIGNGLDNQLTGIGNPANGFEVLRGEGGNDTLRYGARMYGGTGDDFYIMPSMPLSNGFSFGEVHELAGEGYDTVYCRFSSYTVPVNVEAAINDTWGFAGTLTGNELDNDLETTGGGDSIYGMAGNDVLRGHEGMAYDTQLFGGEGDDRLIDCSGGGRLDGGNGNDTAVFKRAFGMFEESYVVDLTLGTATGSLGGGVDVLVSIENVVGSVLGDTIIGDAGKNSIEGDAGNDTIRGGLGDDILNGGDGADLLVGGAGGDRLLGGGGIDTASYADATADVRVDLNLTIVQNTGGSGRDRLVNVENLIGSTFGDFLIGNGAANAFTDTLGGNDRMEGGGGNDVLSITRSGAGPATTVRLDGGIGADTLTFSSGVRHLDTVTALGGDGADVISVQDAQTVTIDAGTGADTVTMDTLNGVYTVFLGTGADTLRLASTGGAFGGSTTNVVRDFQTGAGGDILDLSAWLSGGALTNYTGGSNPFASGHMRLLASGQRTLLQVDRDGGGNGYVTVLTFNGTAPANWTAYNLGGWSLSAAPAPALDEAPGKDGEGQTLPSLVDLLPEDGGPGSVHDDGGAALRDAGWLLPSHHGDWMLTPL